MVSMDGSVMEVGNMSRGKRPVRRVKNMRCAVCGVMPPNQILCYEDQLEWMLGHRDKRHRGLKGWALALYTDEVSKEAIVICCDLKKGDYKAFLKELRQKAKQKEVKS